MAVWTCAVTTRALRGKQFFRCRPLVLAFHTYLTRYLATRNFYPCGRISLWGTGFGECRCGLLQRVQSIVTTCSRFWSWLLVFALFGSHFAEDKLLVLGPWSFQAWIFCKSYTFIVFSGSPVLFLGPAHLGLTPLGSFFG